MILKFQNSKSLNAFIALGLSLLWGSCSSSHKKTPELSHFEGRAVALVGVEGETTAKKIVEVGLVDQIAHRGSFILVSKQDIQKARELPDVDPSNWKEVAKRAGAELALRAKIIRFSAEENQGYSSEKIKDSQLAEDRGDDGATEQVYKVKSLDGDVAIELEFTDLKTGEVRKATAEKQEKIISEQKTARAELPPRLRFLEKLTHQALADFFEKYR